MDFAQATLSGLRWAGVHNKTSFVISDCMMIAYCISVSLSIEDTGLTFTNLRMFVCSNKGEWCMEDDEF